MADSGVSGEELPVKGRVPLLRLRQLPAVESQRRPSRTLELLENSANVLGGGINSQGNG